MRMIVEGGIQRNQEDQHRTFEKWSSHTGNQYMESNKIKKLKIKNL